MVISCNAILLRRVMLGNVQESSLQRAGRGLNQGKGLNRNHLPSVLPLYGGHDARASYFKRKGWVGTDDSNNDEVNGLLLNPNRIRSYGMSKRGLQ